MRRRVGARIARQTLRIADDVCVRAAVKYFNNATNVAIIRCPRSHHRMVWVALTLLTLYEQRQVIVRVIHNGGTIRSCQKRAIARNLELLHQISAPQDLIDQTARDIMSIDAT